MGKLNENPSRFIFISPGSLKSGNTKDKSPTITRTTPNSNMIFPMSIELLYQGIIKIQ